MSAVYTYKPDIMKLNNRKNFLAAELLIEPVDIYAPATVSDGEGGVTVTYSLTGTIWGMYIPGGDTRQLIASEVSFTENATLYVRYPTTVDNNYQLGINGVRYSIHSIKDLDNRHEYNEIKIYR